MTGRTMEFGISITADGKVAVVEAGKVKESFGEIGKQVEQTNRKVEQSAKQTAFAMRQLPMQMTDIAVGLSSGQSPFMVLMQQGGQLKDMFGGIGPAARAVGGHVAALVNPFTVAAVAAGVLAGAYYQGSKEADAYRNALILTGNAAGTTAGRMREMAGSVAAATHGTQGAAAEAVASLAATGKVSADSLQLAATAAVAMQRATGTALGDTAKQFAELGKTPVAASLKLNEQTNYLTASIYRQIKALEERGRIDEAADLAQKTYAAAMIERSGQIEKNLGTLEALWKGLSDTAKGAWDAMLGVGREQSPAERIAELEQKAAPGRGLFAGRSKDEDAELARLKAERKAEEDVAKAKDEKNKQDKAGISLSKEAEKYLSQRAMMARELAQIENLYAQSAKKAGDIEARRVALAGIRKKYDPPRDIEDFAVAQAKQYASLYEAGIKYVDGVNQQFDAGRKLSEGEKILATAKSRLTEAEYKQVEALLAGSIAREKWLQQEEEARKQEQTRLDAQWKAVEGSDAEIKRLQEHNAEIGLSAEQLDALRLARMDDAIAVKERQLAIAEATSTSAAEIETLRLQVEQLRQVRELTGKGQALERANRESVDMWQSIEHAAHAAWNNIGRDGGNTFDQLKRSLKSGIYDLLYQMTVKKWIINIATVVSGGGVAGQAFGSSLSGSLAGVFDTMLANQFGIGGFSQAEFANYNAVAHLIDNAAGGVYSSPSLHSYANTIVDRPTLFNFAQGAAIGRMGEKPGSPGEAIMPLTRIGGDLGVKVDMGRMAVGSVTLNYAPVIDARNSAPGMLGQMQAMIRESEQRVRSLLIAEANSGGEFAVATGRRR